MKIHRRKNNSISNDPCALCGDRTDPTGFDPLTDDHRLVCERCAAIVGVEPAPITNSTHILGACPDCGCCDGYVNAGRTHRAYCLACKTSWIVGSNLFSGWMDETEDQQRAKWDGVFADDQWRDVAEDWSAGRPHSMSSDTLWLWTITDELTVGDHRPSGSTVWVWTDQATDADWEACRRGELTIVDPGQPVDGEPF